MRCFPWLAACAAVLAPAAWRAQPVQAQPVQTQPVQVQPVPSSALPQPVQLTSLVMAERSVIENGRERIELSRPDKVVPGDRLVFETAFRNAGAAPVTRFVVTNPVPAGVAYAGPISAGAELSVDGGRNWGKLAVLRIGIGATARAALPADVTNLRWVLASVPPGGSGTLRFRALVR